MSDAWACGTVAHPRPRSREHRHATVALAGCPCRDLLRRGQAIETLVDRLTVERRGGSCCVRGRDHHHVDLHRRGGGGARRQAPAAEESDHARLPRGRSAAPDRSTLARGRDARCRRARQRGGALRNCDVRRGLSAAVRAEIRRVVRARGLARRVGAQPRVETRLRPRTARICAPAGGDRHVELSEWSCHVLGHDLFHARRAADAADVSPPAQDLHRRFCDPAHVARRVESRLSRRALSQ